MDNYSSNNQRSLGRNRTDLSAKLYQRAQDLMPGGVNSPVRAYGAVGGNPPFILRGKGSHIFDADGNEYIDYICSWGPLILGHVNPQVSTALRQSILNGTSFGAPTVPEVELAQTIVEAVPSIEMVRFVNSGTEATMSALRLARAYTGRKRVIKFAGGYHGHADAFLVQAGSGGATLGIPTSPGVPEEYAGLTLVAEYNDLVSVEALFQAHPGDIAALIVEPVAANMGVVPPAPGFLEGLRDLTRKNGTVFIFDEVITGFRLAKGGAQEYYGVRPDMTVWGKIIGAGLPVGAFGGPRDIMRLLAPVGPVYQAGTLSGNPLAMSAGYAVLRELFKEGTYTMLEMLSRRLADGLEDAARAAGVPARVQRVGSLLTLFFTNASVRNWTDADKADRRAFTRFFHGMLDRGIYLPPSQFEAWFVSLAHTDEDIDKTVQVAHQVLHEVG